MSEQLNWPRLIGITGTFCAGVWVWYTVAVFVLG